MQSESKVEIDALFILACGCILDGCSGSDPGRKWRAGIRNGLLYCTQHRGWFTLVDVVGGGDDRG